MFRLYFRSLTVILSAISFFIMVMIVAARFDSAPTTALAYEQFRPGDGRYIIYSDSLRGLQVQSRTSLRNAYRDDQYSLGSPDGRQYIISRASAQGVDLYIVGPDHSPRLLTHAANFTVYQSLPQALRFNNYPVWSPDSQWVAFISMDTVANMDLYIIRKDGSQLSRVARDIGSSMPLNLQWTTVPSQSVHAIFIILVITAATMLSFKIPVSRWWGMIPRPELGLDGIAAIFATMRLALSRIQILTRD